MHPDILIHSLRIQVDPADSTYMPSVVIISAGDNLSVLKEISTVNLSPTDRIVTLLSNLKEFYRLISPPQTEPISIMKIDYFLPHVASISLYISF